MDFDWTDVWQRGTGSLVGLAVGDALGTTLEFSSRDSHPCHKEMVGGGPFDLPPGVWTDDTSMALALGHSIIDCKGLDPTDLMHRFCAWWKDGAYSPTGSCFDIGVTTREALARFQRTGDPFAGSTNPQSAGNGGIMRITPAVISRLHDPETFAVTQSRTTHGAPEALDAARLMARILANLICLERSATPDDLLVPEFSGAPAVEALARGSWRGKKRNDIRSSGYVIHTLEAALWSVDQTRSFEEALVLAVNLGDDADTVGAVTGQLAGAIYREDSMPARWLEHLAWIDELRSVAGRLLNLNSVPLDLKTFKPIYDPICGPTELRGIAAVFSTDQERSSNLGGSGVWSDQTKKALKAAVEREETMHVEQIAFKNNDGRFATLCVGDFLNGDLRLVDRRSGKVIEYQDDNELVTAGWMLD